MIYLRDDIDDVYEIAALQDKILQIAQYIDNICTQNNITYYLMGGSALGAIRHGGFIPWDDDLDIFMTPDNYQKFRDVFLKTGDQDAYYLQQLTLRDNMVASAKLRLNNSAYIEEATKHWKIHQGIFVDIFLLHNCPNNCILQLVQCFAAKYILVKGQGWKDIKYRGLKGLIIQGIRFLPKDFGIETSLKLLYKYNKRETRQVCHFMGKAFFKRGIYDSKYFQKPERVAFEKTMLNAPSNTDEYLRERFGEYMKMPSADSIKKAQHAWKWDTNNDFSVYVNQDRGFEDERYLV